jgi:hypothetical protein
VSNSEITSRSGHERIFINEQVGCHCVLNLFPALSMSIFTRPDSPPPRQPSPDILPTPLPHPRRLPSQPKIRVQLPHPSRSLHSMRSMDFTNEGGRMVSEDGHDSRSLPRTRKRTRSTFTSSSTPRSSPSPCPSTTDYLPDPVNHNRTLSVAIPSPSPSPTPTMVCSVPPLPSSKPSVVASSNNIVCPKPVSLRPILFDQTDGLAAIDLQTAGFQRKLSKSNSKRLPPLEKHKNVGLACLRFFGIKSQLKQSPNDVTSV